jgi:hypothetical protein
VLFTERYGIVKEDADDWFDVALHLDTPLFLDPFLVYSAERGHFVGSHAEIIRFFECVFRLIAGCHGDTTSADYRRALHCLHFPEVEELCLGYTAAGTRGAGSGARIAGEIAAAIQEAINAGITDIRHFEKIAILREGIGADRISDITAALLRRQLVKYTEEVCERHGIDTEPCRFIRGDFDFEGMRWQVLTANLPINQYNEKPILLVPARYVRELPTINADGFMDFCRDDTSEALRAELNADISRRVPKSEIVALARRHPRLLEAYVTAVEDTLPRPYDFGRDQRGLVSWYAPTRDYCAAHPLEMEVNDADGIGRLLDAAVDRFKAFVEDHEGWRGMWNPGRAPKDERAAQMLLLGVVTQYCEAAGVIVQPAQNVGRAVATFSKGEASVRALLELKLARNRRFWNSIERTQPDHERAGRSRHGAIVIVMMNFDDIDRANACSRLVAQLRPEYNLRSVTVDAGHDETDVWRPAPAVQAGDTFNINAPVTGSALGAGASVEARDITVAPAPPDGWTYEI